MVKLLLRKQETWHRLDTLKYESELGSVSAIVAAIDELCQLGPKPPDIIKKEELEEQEIVDLLMDESVANLQTEQDKPASVDAEFPELSENRPLALARSEREMDLKSLLECLRLDELKSVAKQLKLRTNQKVDFLLSNDVQLSVALQKDDLIKDLLGASSSQSTLTSFASRDGVTPSKDRGYHQTKLSFGKLKPQQDRLKEIVLSYIGMCPGVRVVVTHPVPKSGACELTKSSSV